MDKQTMGRQAVAGRQAVVDLDLISFPVLIPICYPLMHLLETVYLIGMYGVMIISKMLALHPRQWTDIKKTLLNIQKMELI